MRFKKNKEPETFLSITPLIDIVFLLLIFFMLTSHFTVASGVPIKLPKIAQHAYEHETRELIISIDKDGRIHLKGKKISLKNLASGLQTIIKEESTSQLMLKADKDTRHGLVVQVMDVAKRAGVSSIVIAAQWDPQEAL